MDSDVVYTDPEGTSFLAKPKPSENRCFGCDFRRDDENCTSKCIVPEEDRERIQAYCHEYDMLFVEVK